MHRSKNNKATHDERAIERAAARLASEHYELELYISGMSPRSIRAINNVKAVCSDHLRDRHSLRIIDVYQDAEAARDRQIVAAPTLLKVRPSPVRRLVGDLSDTKRVLIGLDLHVSDAFS